MLAVILGIPILGILTMLQSVVFSRIPILFGTADIILLTLLAWALQERVRTYWIWTLMGGLMVSLISALPNFTLLWSYLAAVGVARLLRHQVWETPILTMLLATFVGTLLVNGLTLISLQLSGVDLPFQTSLNLIALPSTLLNLLLALPVYALIRDFANTLYPPELEA